MITWSLRNSSKPLELLRVQGPKSNISAVGDYLRVDVPFEGKNDNFDPVSSYKERYGVQLNMEFVPI
jgi:hypothetical protein